MPNCTGDSWVLLDALDSEELLSLPLSVEHCECEDDGGVSISSSMGDEGVGVATGGSFSFRGGESGGVVTGGSIGVVGAFPTPRPPISVVGMGVGLCGMVGVMSAIVSPGVADGAGGDVCGGTVGGI